MADDKPVPEPAEPEPLEYIRIDSNADPSTQILEQLKKKDSTPPPTAANPPPPEFIPSDSMALAICLSPDVCRSPEGPVPYMSWGKASDSFNYSPDVRSNGLFIKRQDSKFSCCYGDEPGVGLGVKSGTVGDVVEPVTSSGIVRANGFWVQRHNDRCTLNRGNTEGEYVHVKSTDVHAAPDATDDQDKAWYSGIKKGATDFWDGITTTSDTAKAGEGIASRVWDYTGNPSLIQKDATSAWNALPTAREAWDGTKNFVVGAGEGAAHVAQEVWSDPSGSASKSADWVKGEASSAWTGTKDMYAQGGVPKVAGAAVGVVGEVFNPLKKVKMAKEAGELLEGAEDIAKAEHRLKEAKKAEDAAKDANKLKEAEKEGDKGARSTREVPVKEVECFNKPKGISDKEFERQLQEQEDAINNTNAETLLERRKAIADAGGTKTLRDLPAQGKARKAYERDRIAELIAGGMSRRNAAAQTTNELSTLAATHRLDIIAGGDPSDISGMGDRSVNSSLGSQWKGRRSQSMEDSATEMKVNGFGKEKMKVKLRKC